MSFDYSKEGAPYIDGDVRPRRSRYNVPLVPHDEYAAELLKKYDLPEDASLAQIKPVAEKIWEDPDRNQKITAVELTLGLKVTTELTYDPADPYGFEAFMTLADPDLSFTEAWEHLSTCRVAFLPKSNPDGFRPPLETA